MINLDQEIQRLEKMMFHRLQDKIDRDFDDPDEFEDEFEDDFEEFED